MTNQVGGNEPQEKELDRFYVTVPVHKSRIFTVEAESEDLAAEIVLDYLTNEKDNKYGFVPKNKINPAIKDHTESEDIWSGDGDTWEVGAI